MKVTRDKSRLINSQINKFTKKLDISNLADEFIKVTKLKFPNSYKNLGK